jgi:hypothetical protein
MVRVIPWWPSHVCVIVGISRPDPIVFVAINCAKMTGGQINDAYGFVNVISPCGLPMRGIVGISPDPIMFVAINCANVQQSKAFYEQLGFVEQV